ncbi:hypothetical protein PVK06_026904 [Gossypium arboreum]|uniref:Reverse transcriptase domain-containing protein n=1 Tax=Gossypium arboreum TaxID=29729 RepID=A0ABR0NYX2_GOSAR|nr:hypothetical protein PVK06_026904 [Gossypium arboreum]
MIDQDLNNTLIVLIPKKENPEDFSHFRPISLCSVLYKLVMKVVANRFKIIFPKLLSQEQAGFIAGRNISDNIILAQEVIHSMRCKRKSNNWMAIKLDLEKAYDRVSWEFIDASLSAAGIPILLRKVIMSAISSSTMQILWNGVPTHDLVIFGKSNLGQARLLDSIFSQFCEISGHKITIGKSNIFFSKTTAENVRNQINQIFGFQEVQNLGKYLGIHLFHEKVTNHTLSFVVDKVRVLRSKYRWKEQLPDSISRSQCSHLWRSLSKIWPLFRENLIWSLGNGSSVRCWKDAWIPGSLSIWMEAGIWTCFEFGYQRM